MTAELTIQNGSTLYYPPVYEDIAWSTERKGVPGKLTFSLLKDSRLKLEHGDPVCLSVDGNKLFYGFLFTFKEDQSSKIQVTAYDQLRYLTNKDTYVYTNKKASEVVKMLASDFNLNAGTIEDTGYKIPSRVEDNSTLFDMIQNALDLTLTNKMQMYVLYDDYGKLCLKNLDSMKTDVLIDADTGVSYDYTSSIDEDSYNRVKLTRENEDTGKRDVYIAQSGANINKWGVLQYFDTLNEGESGKAKADALLELYNAPTRSFKISKALGSTKVRAGSLVVVMMTLMDTTVKNYMLVEQCKHTFKLDEHFMDLTLRGGVVNV